MAQLFSLKKGARHPSQTWTQTSVAEFDLTEADSVTFVYRLKGQVERVEVTLTVVSAVVVRLDTDEGISDSEGTHQCHVEAVFDGMRMDFPNEGFDTFKIGPTIEA
jgi:hypothetical protein